MFLSGFTSSARPIPISLTIVWIVMLVVLAGITNPVQRWIQWMNVIVSALGVLVFGGVALTHYSSTIAVFTNGMLTMLLTLTFMISLYFATRTLRALILLHSFFNQQRGY
jgi:hypothetical protein